MCGLVTELNHDSSEIYGFCANMLSWMAKDYESSIEILTKAISYYPEEWNYYYLRGFTYWYFLSNPKLALEDLKKASEMKDSPASVKKLTSKLIAGTQSIEDTINFLYTMIEQTSDEKAKSALKNRLKEAYLTKYVGIISDGRDKYVHIYGRKPENVRDLVDVGILKSIPPEPFGSEYTYYFNHETGEVLTTSHKKPYSTELTNYEKQKLKKRVK